MRVYVKTVGLCCLEVVGLADMGDREREHALAHAAKMRDRKLAKLIISGPRVAQTKSRTDSAHEASGVVHPGVAAADKV